MNLDALRLAVKDIHTFYGRKTTEPMLDLWIDELQSYPEDAIASTGRLWCRRNRTVPTVEEFEMLLMENLKGSGFNAGWRPDANVEQQWVQVEPMLERGDVDALVEKLGDLKASSSATFNATYWRIEDWFVQYVGSLERWSRFMFMCFGWKETRNEWVDVCPLSWGLNDLRTIFEHLPPRNKIPPLKDSPANDEPNLANVAVMPGTRA